MPIIISPGSGPAIQELAATLASYLTKISGATFEVVAGDGTKGVAIGTAADFAALHLSGLDPTDPLGKENYILRSHPDGVQIVGATEQGTRHALWDFLYRLGYRQFFPSSHWEVIPSSAQLSISLDVRSHPHFLSRRIWYGFGSYKENMKDKELWDERNRMSEGLKIASGHAYESIIRAHKPEFDAHPEYLASPTSTKFCVSNPGLRQLVIDHALAAFAADPERASISMEPSDGDGWANEADAAAFSSITDRVVTLANEVAAAVDQKYKGKYISIYAYNLHSAPPTIRVHPNVVVNVATAFIKGGYSFDQLMADWRKQGAKVIGVRDYYGVYDTHRDRPGGAGVSNLRALRSKIPHQYELGGRLMSAESTESWGNSGLGHFLAARLLWDSQEDANSILSDFFAKAFGAAEGPMRDFYKLLDRGNQPLFTQDLIGRMYRNLDAARALNRDAAVQERLNDLTLYTRYCDMRWDFENASKNKRAEGIELLRFSDRIRRTGMIHSYVLWRHANDLVPTFKAEIAEMKDANPWRSNIPFSSTEVEQIIRDGIESHPLANFQPVRFSRDLIPGRGLKLPPKPQGDAGYTRGNQTYYVWLDKPGTLHLEVVGGQIATRDETTLRLFAGGGRTMALSSADEDDENNETNGVEEPVSATKFPNDLKVHMVDLRVGAPGLHRLTVSDRGKGAQVIWPSGTPVVVEASKRVQTQMRHSQGMYFYVPKGTKTVGGYANGKNTMLNGDGHQVGPLANAPGLFSFPVPPGQDGKVWSFSRLSTVLLMTTPPFLTRSPEELLLPREVAETDQ